MKRFITSFLSATFVLLAFSLVLYTSCNTKDDLPDPCRHMICENGGVCKSGNCECPAGYEGKYCELKKDPCKTLNCLNGGSCEDGSCKCPFGFQGQHCEKRLADQVKGVWYGPRKCDGSDDVSTLNIMTTDDPFKVKINFPGNDTSQYVIGTLLSSPNRIHIHKQQFPPPYGVSGTIQLHDSTITVDITTEHFMNQTSVRCIGTYKHQ